MKKFYTIILISIISFSLAAQEITIDLANQKQPITGFGGAHYPEWGSGLTNDQVDKSFGNKPGEIGLQILRLPVPTDTSIFKMEVAGAARAKNTGAILFATPWSPPPSMKTNKDIIKGKLDTAFYDDFAHYLDSFGKYLAANNAALYAISIQNEPDYLPTYASCEYTSDDFIKFLSKNASSISGIKIMAPESFQFRHALSDPILNDSAAASHVDIIAGHIYGGGIQDYPLARQKGKDVWMSEYYVGSTNWSGDMETAKLIHDCMVVNFNAFVYWTIKDKTGFISDAGDILKRGYIMSHYAKFIRPGYTRVDAATVSLTNVDVTAYKKDTNIVIVAINRNNAPVSVSIKLQNGTASAFTHFTTTQSKNLSNEGKLIIANGSLAATLEAQSISTFTTSAENGGKKGNIAPVAIAGSDLTFTDTNGDGKEEITLDGSASTDQDGTISYYTWSEAGKQLTSGVKPVFNLGTGIHNIVLTITDSDGAIAMDSLVVTISLPSGSTEAHLWFEAECAKVGTLWNITKNTAASNGYFAVIKPGNNSTASASEDKTGHISWEFDVAQSGNYKVWARMRVPSANDDSYWVKMDSGSWNMWNQISGGATFAWDYVRTSTDNTFSLTPGKHTLTFAYREDGAELDKIYISNTGTVPTNMGGTADTCDFETPGNTNSLNISKEGTITFDIYPNPLKNSALVEFDLKTVELVQISLCDLTGRTLSTIYKGKSQLGLNKVFFSSTNLENGIYICKIVIGKKSYSKQVLIIK